MRASKLRLPESTAAQTRSLSTIAWSMGSARGPAFPMHVVQPYAETQKLSFSSDSSRPAALRYSVTTRDPGARDVLMCGLTLRPLATAFLARRPAASSTLGLEV